MDTHRQNYTPPPVRRPRRVPVVAIIVGVALSPILLAAGMHIASANGNEVRPVRQATADPVALGAIDRADCSRTPR